MKKRVIVIIAVLMLLPIFAGCDIITSILNGEEKYGEIYLPKTVNMTVGDTLSLDLTYAPDDMTVESVSWQSADVAVATVDQSGVVTAVREGTAVITATATTSYGVYSDSSAVTVAAAASSGTEVSEQTGDFVITTDDGVYELSGNLCKITAAGTYTVSGLLDGRILIAADEEEDKIVLVLAGVTVISSENSPIWATSADSLKIEVKKDTENVIKDTRAAKSEDSDDQGEGAVSAKCDLKITGEGTLSVEANYNNGVHTTKDLKIEGSVLTVKAPNNALKGKNSVTIDGGVLAVISTAGDGIKTEDTDVSEKGKQRGTITVNGGETTVYAAGDGIQAAYDFVQNGGALTIYTGSQSGYTAKNAAVDSYKGVKVKNELVINDGNLYIASYDDGLHADYGAELENGEKGVGTITINGGAITIKVNASSGRFVTGADAVHADNLLTVNGGTIKISSSYEGLEANFINITGGDITVNASDDGVNAAKKIGLTPAVTVSGGKLDVTMGGGDTDGIDSNGSFTQTGGLIIVRGAPNSNSSMATGLDCDGKASITGGTFIQLGARETVPTTGNGVYTLNYGSTAGGRGGRGGNPFGGREQTSSERFTSGTWTIDGADLSFTVADGYTYYGAVIYSDALQKGVSYTVRNGSVSYTAAAS